MLFSLGQVLGEGSMLFSLDQVLGLLCAREGAVQSCGIYSKSILPSLSGARRALRNIRLSDCFAPEWALCNPAESIRKAYSLPWVAPVGR
jgi:hypothetical protein